MSINWLVLSSQWSIKDNCKSGCGMTRIWRDLGLINLRTEFFINYKDTVDGFLRQPPPTSRLKRRPQITMNTHRDLITRLFVPDDKMDWWSAIKMVSSHQTRFLLSTWLVAKTETSGVSALSPIWWNAAWNYSLYSEISLLWCIINIEAVKFWIKYLLWLL